MKVPTYLLLLCRNLETYFSCGMKSTDQIHYLILHKKYPNLNTLPSAGICTFITNHHMNDILHNISSLTRAGAKVLAVHADAWGGTILGAACFRIKPYINIDCLFAR
jgi:hypothetical protein